MMNKTMTMIKESSVANAGVEEVMAIIELTLYALALPQIKKLDDLDDIITQEEFNMTPDDKRLSLFNDRLNKIKKSVTFKDEHELDECGIDYININTRVNVDSEEEIIKLFNDLMVRVKMNAIVA